MIRSLLLPLILLGSWAYAGPARADLQWITGSVPQAAAPTGGTSVSDAPPSANPVSEASPQDVLVCHMITCTKIVNNYPNDSVNYFYLGKNDQVCFYFYFLIKPESRIHTVTVECFNPSGIQIAKYDQEFRVAFTDRLLTVGSDTYQWFLTTMTLGMDHMHAEYGQTGLPQDTGLYTFDTSVDGRLVGITFFYVKTAPIQPPSPIATVAPGSSSSMPAAFLMSTPVSSQPMPNGIP